MMDSAVSDLPLPDSPTRQSVSPVATLKLTSITAGTKRPSWSKPVVRWETDSRDLGIRDRSPGCTQRLEARFPDP